MSESLCHDECRPEISPELNETILNTLVSILSPVGEARRRDKESNVRDGDVLKDLYVGMNHVTIELEKSVKSRSTDMAIVLVCRGDIEANHVYGHLPSLVCIVGKSSPIRLVPLAKGALERLSFALGLKHVYALAIKKDATQFSDIISLVNESVPLPSMPWLEHYVSPVVCKVPTNIRESKKRKMESETTS